MLSVLAFLTHMSDTKEQEQLFLGEMKVRSAANKRVIPGWNFLRIWYFNDIQVLLQKAREKSRTELSVLCLPYQIAEEEEEMLNKENSLA